VKIVFHPRVFSEIDAIMRYYEDVAEPDLADDFYEEFRASTVRTAEHPESVNERIGGLKRVNLKRFPYNYLFNELPDHVRILVIRHHARHPVYGTKR